MASQSRCQTKNNTLSDLEVKLVDTRDTLQCQHLTGHTRGLRGASWHPSGSHLVRRIQRPRQRHINVISDNFRPGWQDYCLGLFTIPSADRART